MHFGSIGHGLSFVAVLGWPVAAANAQLPEIVAPQSIAVTGDAILTPLTATPADPARGRAIVLDRAGGNCLICHRVPEPAEPFQGTIGPDLTGVGQRLSAGQLRLRLVDQSRLNPATMMPPFYRTQNLMRVDTRYAGQPVLTAAEIEDVVAYLAALKAVVRDAK